MARLALRARELVVGDLADERLDEFVLTPLRRTRVDVDAQEFAPDKGSQCGGERPYVSAGDGREAGHGEAVPEHGGVLQNTTLGRREAIEARANERRERLRDRQACEVADRMVDAALLCQTALGDEHAYRLD